MSRGSGILVGVFVLVAVAASAQNSPRVGMLEQDGFAALKAGDGAKASLLFNEAIRLDPRNAIVRFGAGVAEFLQRHDVEAKAHLEQALLLDPAFPQARAQLAQVYKRQGDANEAIRLYEIVATELPNDAGVRDTLDRWKRERDLHDNMRTQVGDHFTVSFEGPADAALAEQALESLNRSFWRICDTFSLYPERPVPVILYSAEQFSDITRSPKWAAAAFDGAIRVPMKGAGEKGEDLDRVLAHEFTHALIRSVAKRGLPTWLNEGLASVMEREDLDWAGTVLSRTANAPSLAALAGPFGGLSDRDATVAYAMSTVAAKRLLDEAGGAAVANLLRDLGGGVDVETAFLHRIQRPFADFQASLQ